MNDELTNQLANALDTSPDNIMDFAQQPDGTYNVINFRYQKFTGVEPLENHPVPDHYRAIYENPMRGSKAQLLELAVILDLDLGPKPTKKSIVKVINESKAPPAGSSGTPKPGHMQAHRSTNWEK